MKLDVNLSVVDCGVRMVLGFILINLTTLGVVNAFGFFLGTLLFATAYFHHCPVYAILGRSSKAMDADAEQAL